MASVSLARASGSGPGALLAACVAEHGSAAHPYFAGAALTDGPDTLRNLADAVHLLAALHGRHPGVVELAAGRTVDSAARAWLIRAGGAMAAERAFLARLSVAAGPVPGTPDGGASEAAVAGQRMALATLAQSDRRGCALGAALAFALDWLPVRRLLDGAAARLGLDAPACGLGGETELGTLADAAAETASTERALLFGAQQLVLQHRGLWDLLEARRDARLAA